MNNIQSVEYQALIQRTTGGHYAFFIHLSPQLTMCLLFIAHKAHAHWPLIIASNRDEFHPRATQAAHYWPENPEWLGGKDLEAGGSWLLVNKGGRLGALTNVRNPNLAAGKISRGELVKRAVAIDHAGLIDASEFGGFNLLSGVLQGRQWQFTVQTNQAHQLVNEQLAPGVHGLSNASINTPWPKVASGRKELEQLLAIAAKEPQLEQGLWQLLAQREKAELAQLPDTGVGAELELMLSSRFIVSPAYGTRASTLLLVDQQQRALFIERRFNAAGQLKSETRERFSFL